MGGDCCEPIFGQRLYRSKRGPDVPAPVISPSLLYFRIPSMKACVGFIPRRESLNC